MVEISIVGDNSPRPIVVSKNESSPPGILVSRPEQACCRFRRERRCCVRMPPH